MTDERRLSKSASPEATPAPFVSVVMPVWNEAHHVAKTMAALLSGDYPEHRMEVLVVDGRSTDRTVDVIRTAAEHDARVQLLHNEAGTTPAGLNVGLRAARGDVIVRMDGHTLPAPDYVTSCVETLERTQASMVGGGMVGRGETPFGEAVAIATATPAGAGDARFRLGGEGPVDTVYLGAWRHEAVQRLGGFDERMTRNQDYELSQRMREAGGVVWLDPSIRSTTITRSTAAALARQYFGYGGGRAATFCLHPGSLRPRQALPAKFVLCLCVGAVSAPFAPGIRRWLAALLAVYATLVGVSSVLAGRRATPSAARRLPLVYATIHVFWGLGFWVGVARCLVGHRQQGSQEPHAPDHPPSAKE